MMKTAREGTQRLVQGQITIMRDGHERNLSVRVSAEQTSQSRDSYIITLDDITELVSAQRTSAWGDVARRIAHEIKNPLTPIQLSAERIRRKFGKVITEERASSNNVPIPCTTGRHISGWLMNLPLCAMPKRSWKARTAPLPCDRRFPDEGRPSRPRYRSDIKQDPSCAVRPPLFRRPENNQDATEAIEQCRGKNWQGRVDVMPRRRTRHRED